MSEQLQNPVYQALISGDKQRSLQAGIALYFEEDVSPFAGLPDSHQQGFDALFAAVPAGRLILYATPQPLRQPRGWQLISKTRGIQMVLTERYRPVAVAPLPVLLQEEHVPQMMALATCTKPGPFGPGTIRFGYYHGIFDGQKLVAMTGQRLHLQAFTEISAVCTHPDYLGKGYAFALLQHQIGLIQGQGKTPFLHVRSDNERAIALYHRIGFDVSGKMNFYFMKRRKGKREMAL